MGVTQSILKIAKIRLESTPQDETLAVLKFDMSNAGSDTVRAVVFQISLVEDLSRERTDAPERVVAGPFTIEAKFDLEPVETAEYEALLRNLPTDCRCVPGFVCLPCDSLRTRARTLRRCGTNLKAENVQPIVERI